MTTSRRSLMQLSALSLALGLAAPVRAAPKPLRILILGGTGFTGPHQVRYALSRGHKVTVFNRGRRPQDWPGEVEELIGDRNTGDLKSLEGRTWDVCIDNPTALPFWVRDAGAVLKGKVKRYVFISTISVYASNDTPADETAPLAVYKGKDAYAERSIDNGLYGPLKALSEAEARKQFGASNVTVIRPGLIVGPGDDTDRFTYWPARLSRTGQAWGDEVLAPGDGTDPVQFIDARDLAEWTVRMAETGRTGTFNGTGPARQMLTKELITGVAQGVKATPPKLTWVSTDWLQSHKVYGWSDLPVWLPGTGDTRGFHRRSNRAAVAAGLTFRPLTTTAADTLAWFKTLPPERQGKLKAGLTPEREAKLLAEWKARA